MYKVIEGKRYSLRGLQLIQADSLLPKAGALIQFDFDSAEIKPESYATLDQFGTVLGSRLADAQSVSWGTRTMPVRADYNQALSERRANAVTRYLIGHHPIDQAQILARGAGERHRSPPTTRKRARANGWFRASVGEGRSKGVNVKL